MHANMPPSCARCGHQINILPLDKTEFQRTDGACGDWIKRKFETSKKKMQRISGQYALEIDDLLQGVKYLRCDQTKLQILISSICEGIKKVIRMAQWQEQFVSGSKAHLSPPRYDAPLATIRDFVDDLEFSGEPSDEDNMFLLKKKLEKILRECCNELAKCRGAECTWIYPRSYKSGRWAPNYHIGLARMRYKHIRALSLEKISKILHQNCDKDGLLFVMDVIIVKAYYGGLKYENSLSFTRRKWTFSGNKVYNTMCSFVEEQAEENQSAVKDALIKLADDCVEFDYPGRARDILL